MNTDRLAVHTPHGRELTSTVRTGDELEVPEATVARLPLYLRALYAMAEAGESTVSSSQLANQTGVNSAKVRKDLSYLGTYGTRGVGYEIDILVEQISGILGLTNTWGVVLIGVGHLGQALANYGGFSSRGFEIVALLDSDPETVGATVAGLTVRHISELPQVVASGQVAIGIIATPAVAAQNVCEQLIEAGVTSILNFAPCILNVSDGVDVRKVDLAIELQILSFHENRKSVDNHRAMRVAS